LIRKESEAGFFCSAETLGLDGEAVGGRLKRRNHVQPVGIGHGAAEKPCLLCGRDLRAGDSGPSWIGDLRDTPQAFACECRGTKRRANKIKKKMLLHFCFSLSWLTETAASANPATCDDPNAPTTRLRRSHLDGTQHSLRTIELPDNRYRILE